MLLQVASRNLLRNPRRTLAVMLTVALGTGSIFTFHGFNTGIMNQYRENTIHAIYGHGQLNMPGYRDKVYEKPWEHWITDYSTVRARLGEIPQIKQVFPRVQFFALLTNGRITVSGRGQGVDAVEEATFFNTLNIVEGKSLTSEPDGILMGIGLARALNAHVGDRITILGNTVNGSMNGIDLTLTGIFHTGGPQFDDVLFRLPIRQAQTLLDTDRVEEIALGTTSYKDWPLITSQLKEKLPQLEATPFEVLDEINYQHSVEWLGSQFRVIKLIILTIVVLGIFNTVSTSILERKQEIGNLRANGESVTDVMRLLSLEGALVGLLGSALGIVIALFLVKVVLYKGILMPAAPGLTRQFYVFIELQPDMAVTAFLMGIATALFGTVLAGLRVAKTPIGEALRST